MLWIANASVALGFPRWSRPSGIAPTFFIFAGARRLALVFIATKVPETRGLSLEQLEDQFRGQYS